MPRILWAAGYYDRGSPRWRNVRRAFEEDGWTVVECHTDRKGGLSKILFIFKEYLRWGRKCDAVLLPFPAHHLVPLFWLRTRLPKKKLFVDMFISLAESVVEDRKVITWANPRAWWLWLLDWCCVHMADEVLIDTKTHRDHLAQRFHSTPDHFRVVYVGTREDLFFSKESLKNKNVTNVLFVGTYIPLQGVDVIIDAAKIVEQQTKNTHFTLIGNGQLRKAMEKRAEGSSNIAFVDRVPLEQLPDHFRDADIALGIFGSTPKTQWVIPHKVFDALACGVHTITADTPAIHELGEQPLLHLVPAGDAKALAEEILELQGIVQRAPDTIRP